MKWLMGLLYTLMNSEQAGLFPEWLGWLVLPPPAGCGDSTPKQVGGRA